LDFILPFNTKGGFYVFANYKKVFFSGDLRIFIFFLILALIAQVNGYYSTQKYPKSLILNKNYLTFEFFNKTSLVLKYLDIQSFNLTSDAFKNFEFILKNNEKKIVYATLKDKMKAFEEINKKLN
jgi:hypothetical protein